MGIVCTNTWPGTGALWTAAGNNSSDGSAWTQLTAGGSAWTTLTTSASGNVGTFTAQPNVNGSIASWRTGGTSPNDAHVHAVFSMTAGQAVGNRLQGVILNKTASTANTFYLASLNVTTAKGGSTFGLELRRYNAGAQTQLFTPYATISGLNGSTAKWIIQFRVTRIDGGASVLLQARAWQGTNPASPPTGCDWIMSGGITGTGYQSIAVTDSSPLAAGRGGIFLQGNAGTSFTGTYEQFEFRQLSAQTVTATGTTTATGTRNTTKPLTTTGVTGTTTSTRNTLATRAASLASAVTRATTVAATRSTTLTAATTLARATARTISTTLATTTSTARAIATTIGQTLTTNVNTARAIATSILQTLATTAVAASNRAVTIVTTLATNVLVTIRRLTPEPPRIVQLAQRSTLRLAQTAVTRMTGTSTVRWAQTTVTKLTGRSTLRLPKE